MFPLKMLIVLVLSCIGVEFCSAQPQEVPAKKVDPAELMTHRDDLFLPAPPAGSIEGVLVQRDLEKPFRRVSYWGETGCSVVGIILESSESATGSSSLFRL